MYFTNKKFIVLEVVESTNNYANQLVLSKAAEEGTVVLAHFQKSGRGQHGNHWESAEGKNLLASFILYPNFLPAAKQFYLSKAMSLAIAGFLDTEATGVSIKWPNDMYVGTRKIAGILIENSIKGSNLYSTIVGVGLNLNQEIFISDAPNPISLKQITGKNYIVDKVASEILQHLEFWYFKLLSGKYAEIDQAYLNRLLFLNQWAKFAKQGTAFEAQIVGIGSFGELILEERDGKTSNFAFKELEFIFDDMQDC